MSQMQDKVLGIIRKSIETTGLEVVDVPVYANTGRLSIQRPNYFGELGCVTYDFQADRLKLSITIEGKQIMSQPPRQGYFDFYMEYTSIREFENFQAVLELEVARLAKKIQK